MKTPNEIEINVFSVVVFVLFYFGGGFMCVVETNYIYNLDWGLHK